MDIYKIIQSQYIASMAMLRQAIQACPEALWNDPAHKNRFWHIAYHTLFYVHLYLQPAESDFKPWPGARDLPHSLGSPPEESGDGQPYSQEEVQAYVDYCEQQILDIVPTLDLHGPSGFNWLPFSKLETQFYNIRHLMQHTGELMERLWADGGIEVHWVGKHPING
jgi:hypothetical protein